MLRQSGVIRVETVEELVDVGVILTSAPLPKGDTVAVLSNSLALGNVVADSVAAHGLQVGGIEAGLRLDSGQSVALPALRGVLLAALAGTGVHAAVVTLLPARGLSVDAIAGVLAECSAEAGKPVLAAFTGILDPAVAAEGLHGAGEGIAGVPCYTSPGAAVAALAAVCRYAQWLSVEQGTFDPPEGIHPHRAERLLEGLLRPVEGEALHRLDPEEAAGLLGAYGIAVMESVPFATEAEAVAAAGRIGWPVALKTMDAALRHRLDLGGVRLNIADAPSLRRNIALMRELLEPYGNFGMEVQAMAPVGQSCVLRAIEDPLLGPVVSFGIAGDAVNLLDDWAHRVPPLTGSDVAELVRSPRAAVKLFGYQGLPAVDVGALEDLVARLAALKDEHPGIALLEFNPVLVGRTGVTILGADVRIANAAQRTDSARRAMRS
jgi:acyl-CoA synthetase (NDP forming)